MSYKFCQYCEFWLYAYENFEGKYGTCDHPLIEEKIIVDSDEERVLHTHHQFGCIYHSPLHGNVVTKLPNIEP